MGKQQYREHLLRRYRLIGRYTGYLSYVAGAVTASPLVLLIFYPHEYPTALWFAVPAALLAAAGFFLRRLSEGNGSLSVSEGAVIVVLAWTLAVLAGAIPFMFSGLGFVCSVFESVSGWTTTGLSVIDVEKAGHLILFFRSLMQYAGGAGLVILMLSVLAGTTGTGLTAAEGHSEQLIPHVQHSARLVLKLYTSYALLGFAMLWLAGMSPFDAVCHSFSALSTGGFSTHAASVAYWDSPLIEAVLIILMLLGATNFLTAYTIMRGGFKTAAGNGEVRLMAFIISVFTLLLYLYAGPGNFRAAVFQTVTALSTTGFSTMPVLGINACWFTVIVLMVIGGGTGSTAGGIKLHRLYLLLKGIKCGVNEAFLSERAVSQETFISGEHRRIITDADFYRAYRYIALYLLTWLTGGLILILYGYPAGASLFEFASALGTVGLSAGITSPDAPAGVLWLEAAGMMLGRLEFFVIFWGICRMIRDGRELIS